MPVLVSHLLNYLPVSKEAGFSLRDHDQQPNAGGARARPTLRRHPHLARPLAIRLRPKLELMPCRGLVWSMWVCCLSGINIYRCMGGPVIFAAL